MEIDDDFMEIGDTGLIPIGEGLFWDKRINQIVDLHEEQDEPEEDA
jgi:hypothetical protein